MRRAAKVDASQADIVDGLREVGVKVWVIGWPCDLLCLYWSGKYQTFLWQTLESKSPTKTGKRRKRTDQAKQDEFLASTGTPVVLSLNDALLALKGL
ncbi:MAG TPA: hypothetical protein VMS08_06340 [Candidatus Saccharimonadia bacterium]|nr:hypothetical protein [Candidatus Saccharimonadia bacterium]